MSRYVYTCETLIPYEQWVIYRSLPLSPQQVGQTLLAATLDLSSEPGQSKLTLIHLPPRGCPPAGSILVWAGRFSIHPQCIVAESG